MAISTMARSDVPGSSTSRHGGGRRTHRLLYRRRSRRRRRPQDSRCTPQTLGYMYQSRYRQVHVQLAAAGQASRRLNIEQGPLGRVDVGSTGRDRSGGMPLLDALLDAPTPILRCTCIWHLGWRQCNARSTHSALGFGLEGLKRPGPFFWHRQVQCRLLEWRRQGAEQGKLQYSTPFSHQAILEERSESKGIGLYGHKIKRRGESVETCLSGLLRRVVEVEVEEIQLAQDKKWRLLSIRSCRHVDGGPCA